VFTKEELGGAGQLPSTADRNRLPWLFAATVVVGVVIILFF
jgi:hypothetical protein